MSFFRWVVPMMSPTNNSSRRCVSLYGNATLKFSILQDNKESVQIRESSTGYDLRWCGITQMNWPWCCGALAEPCYACKGRGPVRSRGVVKGCWVRSCGTRGGGAGGFGGTGAGWILVDTVTNDASGGQPARASLPWRASARGCLSRAESREAGALFPSRAESRDWCVPKPGRRAGVERRAVGK
jgi:hypothetical protein